MPSSAFSFASSLHMTKPPRQQPASTTPPAKLRTKPAMAVGAATMFSNDPANASSSRSSSLAGKKRPRESDPDAKNRQSRRTKSTGDAKDGNGRSGSSSAKDREAFQRGLIAVFVPKALQESKSGNMSHYNELLAHFLPTPTMPVPALPPLLPLLRAVSAHVSLLSPDIHSPLVTAILNLPWATGEEKFVKTYVGWAAVLVSAQPGWAKEVVGMAVKGLTWQPTFTSSNTKISRRVFHARHHLLLSHLISLVPTLPSVLQPLLIRNFPNKREAEVSQTTWIRNCCELIGYCPELGGRMWGEIVDRMLRIDVEITNSLEDDEDEESEDEDDDLPTADPRFSATPLPDPLDLLISQEMPRPRSLSPDIGVDADDSEGDPDPDDLSSVDGDSDEEEAMNEAKMEEERAKKVANVKAMREKLDGMLVHFFEHLEEYMGGKQAHMPAVEMAAQNMAANSASSSGTSTPTSEFANPITTSLLARRPTPSPAQCLSYFQTLLNLFSRQILPTSATQHIPFLLFLTASFSPAHTDLFLGLLVSQALYATASATPTAGAQPVSINQRIAATVYIGSVVCRARFVSDEQARTVLTYLLAFIDGKLRQSRASKKEGVDELPLFYAVCQAVMLIFCFRWRAFLANAEKEGDSVVGEMDMDSESVEGEEGREQGKWMADLDILQRALTSDLNPLLGCNPTIVSTFAKVAHHTNFAYCFSIIEANQQSTHHTRSTSSHSLTTLAKPLPHPHPHSARPGQPPSRTPSTASVSVSTMSAGAQTLPRQARQLNVDAGLDSYFPFDPYDLPRSKRYIERLYRTWGEVSIDQGDSDSDSDSGDSGSEDENAEEDEDEDSELSDHMARRGLPLPKMKAGSYGEHRRHVLGRGEKQDTGAGLSTSMEGMSISPGHWGMGLGARS
ncbi:hypothetical protein IAT38_007242 [Cryptococcus sp. DSM 104549]